MPISFIKHFGQSTLIIWEITESEEELRSLTMSSDAASAEKLGNGKRRKEHLAWRAALRSMGFDSDVIYNELGAPYLKNNNTCISAAHTSGAALVMISDTACGADIEIAMRDFSKIRSRFISNEETALPQSDNRLFPATVWCAKEAMYKYSGRNELDLIEELKVTSIDFDKEVVTGVIIDRNQNTELTVNMRILIHKQWIVIYII